MHSMHGFWKKITIQAGFQKCCGYNTKLDSKYVNRKAKIPKNNEIHLIIT